MSERYWITGVQLGCLIALQHQSAREDLADLIISGQFIGDKRDLKRILKLNEGLK